MSDMPREKLALQENVDNLSAQMKEIAAAIFAEPELGYQEFRSSARLADFLEANAFTVERGLLGMAHGLSCRRRFGPGPPYRLSCRVRRSARARTCLRAQHGSAWLRRAAGIALVPLPARGNGSCFRHPRRGRQCPGCGRQGSHGGAGLFDSMDAVISTHAEGRTILRQQLISRANLEMDFHGRAAHAAGAPEQGINAQDAAALAIMGINSLRQHMTSDVRIHGLLTDTGTAINTIPEFARLRYGVRARRPETLDRAIERVVNCARCCAQALGCEFSWRHSAHPYYTMRHNMPLLRAFAGNLDLLGESYIARSAQQLFHRHGQRKLQGAVNPSLYFHRRRAPCRTHSGLCGSQQLRMRFQGHAPRRASHGHDRLRRALRRGTAAGCPRGLRQRAILIEPIRLASPGDSRRSHAPQAHCGGTGQGGRVLPCSTPEVFPGRKYAVSPPSLFSRKEFPFMAKERIENLSGILA